MLSFSVIVTIVGLDWSFLVLSFLFPVVLSLSSNPIEQGNIYIKFFYDFCVDGSEVARGLLVRIPLWMSLLSGNQPIKKYTIS